MPFKQTNLDPKLIGKTSPGCLEHCPKLDAQLSRNNFCHPGVAESTAVSVREYSYQLVNVLYPVSVHNRSKSVKPLSMHRIYKTLFYRALLSQEGDVKNK